MEKREENGTTKVTVNGNSKSYVGSEKTAPDGGLRAWLIMFASFFNSGILFGVLNSYSEFQNNIAEYLKEKNETSATSQAALVGSLAMGTTFMISPISGLLTDFIGLRGTTFIGGVLCSLGMFLSSIFADEVKILYFTFGIMYGLGGALSYTPSLAILGHYFDKRLGLANGFVAAGSSVFTLFMPYLLGWLLDTYKLRKTFVVLAILSGLVIPFSFIFKPLNKKPKRTTRDEWKKVFDISIWRNKRYLVWIVFVPISLLGYFVPYVHMKDYVKTYYPEGSDNKLVIVSLSFTSLLGRLIFGFIGDHKKVNRIFLQQVSIFSMGVLMMLISATVGSYPALIVIALCIGFFDGCFISFLGSIAVEICGPKSAAQAIGWCLGCCSIAVVIGPFAAGLMYDQTKSYKLAFVLSGIPGIIGSIGLFLIRFVDAPKIEKDPTQEPLQKFENRITDSSIIKSKEQLNGNML